MIKKNFSENIIMKKFLLLSVCTFSFINIYLLSENNLLKSYAIEKPTYTDMVKNKYGDSISDEKAKSIATEESALKDAYTSGYTNIKAEEITKQTEYPSYYGKYPNGYTGAINYRRKNFLLTAYSLRDISKENEMQPVKSAINEIPNYQKLGFNNESWNNYGLTSTNAVKWLIYQYEPRKLLRVYEKSDYLILSALYAGDYNAVMEEKDNLAEVITLVGKNGIEFLNAGDLLLNYDDENKKVNYVGIYLGKDEDGNPYSLSPNKMILNSSDYAINSFALSYINSSDVYAQKINGTVNLVSGTKYNYGIKLKFLK